MTSAELAKPYGDAATNLRETTKWIVSSLAGTTGLLLGGSVLTGLGSLEPSSDRFVYAAAGIVVFLLSTAIIFILAVLVLISRTIVFDELVTQNRYADHVREVNRLLHHLYPPAHPTLVRIETEFTAANQARQQAIAAGDAAAQTAAENRINAVAPIVFQALLIAGLYEVRTRFRDLCVGLLLIIPMAGGALAYAWATNPGKESAKDISSAYVATLSPAEVDSLTKAGVDQKCLPTNVLWLKERPGGVLDGVTLPPAGCQPAKVLLLEKGRLILAK